MLVTQTTVRRLKKKSKKSVYRKASASRTLLLTAQITAGLLLYVPLKQENYHLPRRSFLSYCCNKLSLGFQLVI